MAERAQRFPPDPGDLRLLIAERRRQRRVQRIGAISLLAILPCAATLLAVPAPRLVWNASASSPRGLYRVIDHGRPERGQMVLARLSPSLARLAAQRAYLPAGVPLVKRVAAGPGDQLCAVGQRLFVNGRVAAVRRSIDAVGRPLPRWHGCRALQPDEFLLLGAHPWSFDGRYAGPTQRGDILARVVLLWAA